VTDFVREGDNGWFFPAGDSEALAEEMMRIIEKKKM